MKLAARQIIFECSGIRKYFMKLYVKLKNKLKYRALEKTLFENGLKRMGEIVQQKHEVTFSMKCSLMEQPNWI